MLKFWVDWTDEDKPVIRPMTSCPDPETKGKTLGRAKKEIIYQAQKERKYWASIAAKALNTRVWHIMMEEAKRDG